MTRLQSVAFINPVFFNGESKKLISAQYGVELNYDEERKLIEAKPPASRNKPTKLIPMSNVSDFEEVDEAKEITKLIAEEDAARIRKAATVTPAQKGAQLRGVEKLIKNAKTGAIEVVME